MPELTPKQYERLQTVFLKVLKYPISERLRVAEKELHDEPEVLSVFRKLPYQEEPGSSFLIPGLGLGESIPEDFIPTLLASHTASPTSGLAVGADIDHYRLIEIIGEGGFGVVWRAERTEPFRQEVALKVVKAGMDSKAVLARFNAERQALALLDHAYVAKVLDGGVTEPAQGSRPYFVMELVRGLSITEHCNRHRLSLTSRMKLFIQVCSAVQHAHAKGVIHRDLKPANILVEYENGKSTPKVIDFGIAKALNQRLSEETIFTEIGQMIGTPEYMSPEQAEAGNQDIDTRSDVYSLGVVLYELLTGVRPFESADLRSAGYAEIQRMIREVEPSRPSTRLDSLASTADGQTAASSIARNRRTQFAMLSRVLRRDLDWVVMKCLEKDRERRYDTADALAVDLRRFLRDEPVEAGPPSVVYRTKKFMRRHRASVITGVGVAAMLVVATVVSIGFAVKATRQRNITIAVSRFMDGVFESVSTGDVDISLRVVDLLDASDRLASHELSGEPAQEFAVRARLASAYTATGFPRKVNRQIEMVRKLHPDLDESFDEQALALRLLAAEATYRLNDGTPKGLESFRALVTELRSRYGASDARTLDAQNQLGGLLKSLGQLDEAEAVYQDCLSLREQRFGSSDRDVLIMKHNLGLIPVERARRTDDRTLKMAFWRQALEDLSSTEKQMTQALGVLDPVTIATRAELPKLYQNLGDRARAESLYETVLPQMLTVFGSEHWRTLDVRASRAWLLRRQGKIPEAIREHEIALEGLLRRRDFFYSGTFVVTRRLVVCYAISGAEQKAIDTFDKILAGYEQWGASNDQLIDFTTATKLLFSEEEVESDVLKKHLSDIENQLKP